MANPESNPPVVIGTRGSPLARWQADHVAGLLRALAPDLGIEQHVIVTTGDRFQAGPVEAVGGKGVWVKEIEEALLAGRIDLAVHSLKDVPATLPDGLVLAAFPARADARDAWLHARGSRFSDLPPGAIVGTSSPRRECQLRAARPDVRIERMRGNVGTRLDKLVAGQVDALLLACAGLDRLGFGDRIGERLSVETLVPAIGQGVLAIEIRAADARMRALCAGLNHLETAIAVAAERALLTGLGGSCRTPLAGYAFVRAGRVHVHGLVGRPDGSEMLREGVDAAVDDAGGAGQILARRLLARGAARILADLG